MIVGELPKSVIVNGKRYAIRTDFRDVIKIICAFNDPELEDAEKVYCCLFILYERYPDIPEEDHEAAYRAAIDFIDQGAAKGDSAKSPRLLDWEQDAHILFPAVNKVAGREVRSAKYIHWWTFMGWCMEITDSVFSQVLSLRLKKSKGKKLEKWEREFWQTNKDLCVLEPKLTAEEQAEKERLNALLG